MQTSYQQKLAALDPMIEADTKASVDKLVEEYAAKGQRIEITETYRQSVRRGIRIGKVFELDRSFENQLSDMRKICDNKATGVINEFRRAKGVTH